MNKKEALQEYPFTENDFYRAVLNNIFSSIEDKQVLKFFYMYATEMQRNGYDGLVDKYEVATESRKAV